MITVAISFYNAEKYLKASIDSVIAQTYTDWKLILMNDGSTDKSLEIANEYAQKDNRIEVFSDGENKNLGYRLNQIINLADTKYLARMDADDIIHPERFERQIKVLETDSSIDVLATNLYTINENDDVIGLRHKFDNPNDLKKVSSPTHATIMGKTEWFKNNPYDIKAVRIEDTELWYRTSEKSNIMMLYAPLYFYRDIGKNYYKKYFLANTCKKYIQAKYANNFFWKKFFILNIIKGNIYRLYNFFGLEQKLIDRRNEVLFNNKKNYKEFKI
ncbi:glycosyltransferase family 2 protein [Capnocytophaga stomatis]|uniref:glycosyltransferase family 2 protein n=1 Tax=Capnocytophaga stomatis TaxID=1848904 RepID=UPI00385A71E8